MGLIPPFHYVLSKVCLKLHNFGIEYNYVKCMSLKLREGGDNGLFITLVPKVYYNVFLCVGITTLGTLNFDWLIH